MNLDKIYKIYKYISPNPLIVLFIPSLSDDVLNNYEAL
jgi:hypothetical protein